MAGIEGEGPRGEPTPHQPSQPEQIQPLQGRAEGRESLQGPTTVDRSEQLQPKPESARGNPLAPHDQEHRGSNLSPAEQADPAKSQDVSEWLRELPQRLAQQIWEATWKRIVEEEWRKRYPEMKQQTEEQDNELTFP